MVQVKFCQRQVKERERETIPSPNRKCETLMANVLENNEKLKAKKLYEM